MNAKAKCIVWGAFLICLAGVLPHAQQAAWGQSAESLARKGNELYKQGNYEKAADAYRQALIRKPDNSLFKYNLGTALAKAGKTAEAQQALNEAAEIPGAVRRRDSLYNLGVAVGEAAQKALEAPAGGPAAPGGAPAGPDPAQLQKQITALEQSLGAFRKTILTDAKDDYAKYNYETVQAQIRQLRQQLEQMKQNQQGQGQNQQNQNGKNQQQNKQQQGNQKNGGKQQQPQQGNQQQGQSEGSEGGDQLKPEQIDALGLLNLLEAEKPEQFKQLFKFRGGEPSGQRPQRNW